MDNLFTLFSLSFALFLLMDPLGNVPLFVSILKEVSPKRQRVIILRELIIALLVIILFNFLGSLLLDFLNIDCSTLLIAGGIILFLIALRMIFPNPNEKRVTAAEEKEPFIVPLAIPLVAGPAVLAAVMLYSYQERSRWITTGAIVVAWLVSTAILLAAPTFKKLLGTRGLIACERLMGLLLTLLSVQMFLEGVALFMSQGEMLPPP